MCPSPTDVARAARWLANPRMRRRSYVSFLLSVFLTLAVYSGSANAQLTWAWGSNNGFPLGDGGASGAFSASPEHPSLPSGVTLDQVSGGTWYGLGLDSQGDAWAWGNNVSGQLGDGSTATSSVPVPVTMPAGVTFTAVSAGYDISAALDTQGNAWMWGAVAFNSPALTPEPVPMPAGVRFTAVAATGIGQDSAALDTQGTLWVFGSNVSTPIAAAMNGVRFVALSDGIALDSTGHAWYYGVTFTSSGPSVTITEVPSPPSAIFTDVSGLIGEQYLALDTTGQAWAWGYNNFGQLGNGTTSNSYASVPQQVTMPAGVTFASVEDSYNTSFAVDTLGRVWAWGLNDVGELGIGTYGVNGLVPVQVSVPGFVTDLTGGFAGANWGFALALTDAAGITVSLAGSGSGTVTGSGISCPHICGHGYPVGTTVTLTATPAPGSQFAGWNGSGCSGTGTCSITLSSSTAVTATFTGGGGGGGVSLGGGVPGDFATSCSSSSPVDCVTGEFWHAFTDLSVPGRGLGLRFVRTYSSLLASRDGPFGYGWAGSYDVSLTTDSAGNASVRMANGSMVLFTPNGAGGFSGPSSDFGSLARGPGAGYTYTRKTGDRYVFDASGRLTAEQDRNGETTVLGYDGAGRLASVTDSAGRSVTVAYGANGKVSAISGPGSRTVRFAYDAGDNLTQVTDPAGGRWAFAYSPSHLLAAMTDPRGGTTTNVYDASGRVVSQTDAMSRRTTFVYSSPPSAASGTTLETDPLGRRTLYSYSASMLTSLARAYGTAEAATWRYSYDPVTHGLASVTDPDGHTATTTYDRVGNFIATDDGLGRRTSYAYNGFGELTGTVDPMGATTKDRYDARGNLVSVSRSSSAGAPVTTRYVHGDRAHPGDVTAMIDPDGLQWRYTYNRYGDRTGVIDPLGERTSFGYDQLGQMTSKTSARGNARGSRPARFTTRYGYDALGDQTSVTDPLGHTTIYRHDPNRNLVAVTDPAGDTTTYSYDADNEATRTVHIGREGRVLQTLRTGYDSDGEVLLQVDGAGHTTSYSYDQLGLRSSVTDSLRWTTGFGYDRAGNVISQTDPSGQVTRYGYDPANELTSITYSVRSTPRVTLAYDADGERVQMTDGSGTTTYRYDAVRRLTQVTSQAGRRKVSVRYAYDPNGNIVRIVYPGGKTVRRGYDAANRLTSIRDWRGDPTGFSYDADGNLIGEKYPNGIRAAFAYDAADRIGSILDKHGRAILLDLAYQFDRSSRLTKEGQTSLRYDGLGRLIRSTGIAPTSYQFDPADEISHINSSGSSETLRYDPAGELKTLRTHRLTIRYTYDRQGARVTAAPSRGASTRYGYDQAGRLVSFSRHGLKARFRYNGDGLRTSSTTNGKTRSFIWDTSPSIPSLVRDGSESYIYGPQGWPLEQIAANGHVLYYIQDQLGSTRLLTGASGKPQATFAYDPYGNLVRRTGAATTPFGFAGEYTDPSGLIYLRARYYQPATGQFLSRDPLSFTTREPYTYAGNSPQSQTDPSGLAWCGQNIPFDWQCDAALGFLHINSHYIAPVVRHIAPGVDQLATACSGLALRASFVPGAGELADLCAAISGTASNYIHLSLVSAGCQQASDELNSLEQEIPGIVLPGGLGKASDYGTGLYGVLGPDNINCPCQPLF